MHRFFISSDSIDKDVVVISGETAHQIGYVLRLKPGNRITVLDNSGWEFEVEIARIDNKSVQGAIVSKQKGQGEPSVKITLCQALLKTDKFEWVLQKGVELGVTIFIPFISERCVVKKPSTDKIERWQKIIKEAAEQSERSVLPVLHPVVSFAEACQTAKPPALLLWEEEKYTGLKEVLQHPLFKNTKAITLFIGPEGGFPESEVEIARKQGIVTASLGQRVLRAETASLAAISAMMYETGEMGK